ncbi:MULTISPECIES: peptidylprolyl isomerase [Colwellia]|uniref:Peptidyl-prolyl cis-trans isomerase n=1 Tax=Colwellia marinimaniae TaxID=1513592 RepID=A0ABQ0MTZ4_9GAMM|nr:MULTISPECIES: peptidylprolyl isomerase [Colwellia]GAW95820.1 peptidyl-prolyl cis-trans isomerase [Colwellia marinimaniae]
MFTPITKKTITTNTRKVLALLSIATASLGFANTANATIVEFQTSQGTFQVNLFDTTTPATVKNFLTYLNDGHYNNSVVHRVVTDFIVQGGGYQFTGTWPLTPLSSNVAVINEPVYSNVKGTIAMAKKGGNIHSATNQWFFNLADNSDNLDRQNGGFTVFGQVIGDGMLVVAKIAQLKLCTYGDLEGIPMVMADEQKCTDMVAPGMENFVVIEHVTIIDNSEVTDSDLIPVKNTLINADSGGSITWLSLVMLALVSTKKRFIR